MTENVTRIHLVDDDGQPTGRWFNPDKAKMWEEATRWNGSNHISLATGSQWNHETLYLTAGGTWVLHWSSQWQGSTDRYQQIKPADAAAWLVRCEHDPPDELAEYVSEAEV